MRETLTPRSREAGNPISERGAAFVELALVGVVLAVLVFGVIDLARAYQLNNRLEGMTREGTAFAQFHPNDVDTGCNGTANIVDRSTAEDHTSSIDALTVLVERWDGSTSSWVSHTGCLAGGAPPTTPLSAEDRIRVTVQAEIAMVTPLIGAIVGSPMTLTQRSEVEVQ